jgi:hypothetical protein
MRGLGEICECRQSMARYDELCHLAEELQKKDAAEKCKAGVV